MSDDERTPILKDDKNSINITNESDEKPSFSFSVLNQKKKLTFITLAFVNFCACASFSLLAPFFPSEAQKKGASHTVIGFIFSSFEFVIFVFSPIFGIYLTRLGPKFVFISGIFVCGVCAILFGLLDKSPPGTIFIAMCFITRSIEAMGCAAFITASFAIVAFSFPDNVATVFGTLETFSGLGMMVGPPLGGALYELGGYGLPFWSLGSFLLLCGTISFFMMPSNDEVRKPYQGSVFKLLTSSHVLVTCFSIFVGAFSLGFLDPSLADHLKPFKLKTWVVGFIFLCAPGVYGFTAPFWGWVGDKKGQVKSLMIVGNFFGSIAFFLLGPCPLMPFLSHEIWQIIISLLIFGFFVGCSLIQSLSNLLLCAKELGFDDSLDTYGLVSGLFNSAFCLGTFIGPTVSGLFVENFGFQWASTVVAFLFVFSGTLLCLYYSLRKCKQSTAHADLDKSIVNES